MCVREREISLVFPSILRGFLMAGIHFDWIFHHKPSSFCWICSASCRRSQSTLAHGLCEVPQMAKGSTNGFNMV